MTEREPIPIPDDFVSLSANGKCCCGHSESINTAFKCLPRALDLGHCGQVENLAEDGSVPEWCCRSERNKGDDITKGGDR